MDITLRITDLVAAIRAAYATSVIGLTASEQGTLTRAALGELANLAEPRTARAAFRPIVVAEPARPSALGTGVCAPADAVRGAPTAVIAPAIEQRIAEVLSEPAHASETIDVAFRRKERTLCDVFGSLSPLEAHALHRRLANPMASDVLAMRFARLVADRRIRLLAFLDGARRRAALRSAS